MKEKEDRVKKFIVGKVFYFVCLCHCLSGTHCKDRNKSQLNIINF